MENDSFPVISKSISAQLANGCIPLSSMACLLQPINRTGEYVIMNFCDLIAVFRTLPAVRPRRSTTVVLLIFTTAATLKVLLLHLLLCYFYYGLFKIDVIDPIDAVLVQMCLRRSNSQLRYTACLGPGICLLQTGLHK
jgi:hypothetical protein